jgi:hypothetical protein
MTSLHPLTPIFNKYLNQEVKVTSDAYQNFSVDPSDPVFAEFKKELAEKGYGVWGAVEPLHKGKAPTGKVVTTFIKKKEDGKYHIDSFRAPF